MEPIEKSLSAYLQTCAGDAAGGFFSAARTPVEKTRRPANTIADLRIAKSLQIV
jgi:hypothetical protein